MKVLWATKIGEPDYMEQCITEQAADPQKLEAATEWAKAQGFDRFRVSEFSDEPEPPEFGANLLN